MHQTAKTVAHAPMKIQEPLLIGTLLMLLIGFNLAAGTRFTVPNPLPGLSLFQTSVAAPAPLRLSPIED